MTSRRWFNRYIITATIWMSLSLVAVLLTSLVLAALGMDIHFNGTGGKLSMITFKLVSLFLLLGWTIPLALGIRRALRPH